MKQDNLKELSPLMALLCMILVALMVPIVILLDYYEEGFSIFVVAPVWLLSSSQFVEGHVVPYSNFSMVFNPLVIINQIQAVAVRFLYVYWVYQFYLEKATMKQALIIGIIAEILGPIVVYIMLGASWAIVPFVPLTFPLVLIVGYFLMVRKKPPIHVEWLEKAESE